MFITYSKQKQVKVLRTAYLLIILYGGPGTYK